MAFWIVETKEQLNKLSYNKPCFVNVIPLNHNYHPSLTRVSLIYIKSEGHKGYIIPIEHNDGFSLDLQLVKEFILKHPNIYVLDKKKILYWLGEEFISEKVLDINLLHLDSTIHSLNLPNFQSKVGNYIESSFKSHSNLNSFIPITKHYEEQEQIYDFIKHYIGIQRDNAYYQNDYIWNMYCIEKQGITLNFNVFQEHFTLPYKRLSIKDDKIYSQYNLYNFTSRPSNAFNGVNFAALNKSNLTREFIIPTENWLFEYDVHSYHLVLSSKLINYKFKEKDVHTELGKFYFNKELLTADEYKKSKQLSFKMMNGGVYSQYKQVPFWRELENYIKELWIKVQEQNYIELVGGRKIKLEEISNPTPQKIYNYLIQSYETFTNIQFLKKLLKYLENKQSNCILYTYDSVLIDYIESDGKETLKDIKTIIESEGFRISVSYGNNYNNMKKIT